MFGQSMKRLAQEEGVEWGNQPSAEVLLEYHRTEGRRQIDRKQLTRISFTELFTDY
jgi:PP-loop superfamily ATP-utilizing enzyme